jgi:hypothetical protein
MRTLPAGFIAAFVLCLGLVSGIVIDVACSCRVTLSKSPLGFLKSTYAVRQ